MCVVCVLCLVHGADGWPTKVDVHQGDKTFRPSGAIPCFACCVCAFVLSLPSHAFSPRGPEACGRHRMYEAAVFLLHDVAASLRSLFPDCYPHLSHVFLWLRFVEQFGWMEECIMEGEGGGA